MRLSDGKLILSPSDLMRFQGCEHSTALDLEYLRGRKIIPAEDAPDAVLTQKKGQAHEDQYLAKLGAKTGDVVSIERSRNFSEAAEKTRRAMAAGAGAVFQGALESGRWQGYSDFLERVEEPSGLGQFGYEVVDTKLKRRPDPRHAIQVSLYSKSISGIQQRMPAKGHIELGTGERATFRTERVRNYSDNLAVRLEAFVDSPWPTVPEPVAACGLCRWRDHCADEWNAADSLTLVAGITSSQRQKLARAGVVTMTALAGAAARVPGLHPATLAKLVVQARLQKERRLGGQPRFELKALEPLRGFNRMPEPSAGDLYFDMEGDPFFENGLEYLFGVYHETQGKPDFRTWWAHDENEERESVLKVLEFFIGHLAANPSAFIYHYNHYEVTALKRVTSKWGVGEIQLDHLLRTKRFVDLYRVVQQAMTASESGYSLKDIEAFYMPPREEAVTSAVDSIVAYENWRETKDQAILDGIAQYNETDCRSTKLMRDWLLKVRSTDAVWFVPTEIEVPPVEGDPERDALKSQIDAARGCLGTDVADLLFELNAFHRRADKPQWWEYFDRQDRETDALIDDLECLGGLVAAGGAQGTERTYEYPPQETKMRAGSKALLRGVSGIATIMSIAREKHRITVKFPKKVGTPPDRGDLIPQGPIPNTVLRNAVKRVTESLVRGESRYAAVEEFLRRKIPRISGIAAGSPIAPGISILEETSRAVANLDHSCLPIQGPPGTGKTYASSHVILDLVGQGRRVAVSSNAHKAIDNLLKAVADRARERNVRVSIVKRASSGESDLEDPLIELATENDDPSLRTAQVVGGTAYLLARPEFDQTFDHLFVDEAGQVSIANLVAMATAAENIVLVGDQMQLPQPVQGVHPGESGLSSLDYLLHGVQTVDSAHGIFLPVSRRMHPDVCHLISRLAYDGRLESDREAENHRIEMSLNPLALPQTGVLFVGIEHSGNGQTSVEEAKRLAEFFDSLLAGRFTSRDGIQRKMAVEDILVVSPYNAQVNLLTEKLPAGARVGTVDRFQGQEAPACLISFATSSAEELPRDIEFLFSLNRLNVAISRAQALAIIFASPRLLQVSCKTMDELFLVNGLCSVRDYATTFGKG